MTSGDFLSLKSPLEIELPNFTILVGENGAGKSHLLQLLLNCLQPQLPRQRRHNYNTTVHSGLLPRGQVVLESSSWPLQKGVSGAAEVQKINQKAQIYLSDANATTNRSNDNEIDEYHWAQNVRAIRDQSSADPDSNENFKDGNLPPRLMLQRRPSIQNLVPDICNAFYQYQMRVIQRQADEQLKYDEASAKEGEPPWRTLNRFLTSAGIRYRCVPPTRSILAQYQFELKDELGTIIAPNQLSSGEKTVVAVALWILSAGRFGRLPKVVLLDEADAHLHPAMIPGFVGALRDVLVSEHGCKIVLASHRSETVCSVSEDCLVEMHRTRPRLRFSAGTRHTISVLTGGRFTTKLPTRCVLVEDNDDQRFYQAATQIYAQTHSETLTTIPNFQAVSTKGPGKDSGGRAKVESWVDRLEKSGLTDSIYGLVDHDYAPAEGQNVYQIPRHSIENYLLDPILLYTVLLNAKKLSSNPFEFGLGDDALIRIATSKQLQSIADFILSDITYEGAWRFSSDQTELVPISYQKGQTINVPIWTLIARGKDVLACYQKGYPDHGGTIGVKTIISTFERLALLPNDLVHTLQSIATASPTQTPSWRIL